ncbi:MFS transporter [Amycolatopsis acidiphila]|uniref:MFS transporter n=1 Tax=Amycolatopsis acidiphila TaxID=715473 RepID=UPI001994390E|nr:MFS transporter [Amycolatopsis acidiphila]UIJ58379.1 MFS transporter [Amycolatopsis acidiphila]GHG93647.1 hypothetical protein GCM10017788_71160 [Amycolatopsis acidiphila]
MLLLGLTVTGSPVAAPALLAGLTASSALGGPVFGALLDRARRPGRLLAVALSAYASGLAAVLASVGHLPLTAVVALAVLAGLFNPAVAGGWTSQLPHVLGGRELSRATALDALTFSVASLAGPALAALLADRLGAPVTVATAVGLVALALPSAWFLPGRPVGIVRQTWTTGFRVFARQRTLLRATLTSTISYAGVGMTTVCHPLLGAQRLGGASRGALLLAVLAAAAMTTNAVLARHPWRGTPDGMVFASTLVLAAGAALSTLPGPAVVLAAAVAGTAERPADGTVRRAAPGRAGAAARTGLHDRGQPEGDRLRRRFRARGPAGRRVTDRLPARGGRDAAARRDGLPGAAAAQNAIACARRLTSVPWLVRRALIGVWPGSDSSCE